MQRPVELPVHVLHHPPKVQAENDARHKRSLRNLHREQDEARKRYGMPKRSRSPSGKSPSYRSVVREYADRTLVSERYFNGMTAHERRTLQKEMDGRRISRSQQASILMKEPGLVMKLRGLYLLFGRKL